MPTSARPVTAAAVFGAGETPTISVVMEATAAMNCPLDDLVAALQIQADELAGVWGTPCKLEISPTVKAGTWSLILLDNADQAGALGYHDVTSDGLPQGKVFVITSDDDGALPSTVASHELCEMLVDPDANTFKLVELQSSPFVQPSVYMAVLEVADAVEADSYTVQLPNGHAVPVSDYVLPSWFESFSPPGTKLDRMGLCTRPWEIRAGGYLPVLDTSTMQWEQLGAMTHRPRNRMVRRTSRSFR